MEPSNHLKAGAQSDGAAARPRRSTEQERVGCRGAHPPENFVGLQLVEPLIVLVGQKQDRASKSVPPKGSTRRRQGRRWCRGARRSPDRLHTGRNSRPARRARPAGSPIEEQFEPLVCMRWPAICAPAMRDYGEPAIESAAGSRPKVVEAQHQANAELREEEPGRRVGRKWPGNFSPDCAPPPRAPASRGRALSTPLGWDGLGKERPTRLRPRARRQDGPCHSGLSSGH